MNVNETCHLVQKLLMEGDEGLGAGALTREHGTMTQAVKK